MANLSLKPILPKGQDVDREQWENTWRPLLRQHWLDLLGRPSFRDEDYSPDARLVHDIAGPVYRAQWWEQPTGPDASQKVVLLWPNDAEEADAPLPGAVVPTYHPENVAGLRCDATNQKLLWDSESTPDAEVRRLGAHLARQGYIVACVEAFPFNTVMKPKASNDGFAWWRAGAAKVLADNPHWTGMGKLVHDTSRGLDLLLEQRQVDPKRIAMVGHSLGGKRTLYTAALDERVTCAIGSDFGLPWRSTNWHEPWYLGDRVPTDEAGLAHHQLLALMAPRPFFLIAGETDAEDSFRYLDAARPAYALYGRGEALTGFNHATGHRPSVESLDRAYAWLSHQLDQPQRPWHDASDRLSNEIRRTAATASKTAKG